MTPYRAVVLEHLGVRTTSMEGLQFLDEISSGAPKPLGYVVFDVFNLAFCHGKLPHNFFLAQGVVLELLSRLPPVHDRRKGVMKSELARENVHHDTDGVFVRVVAIAHLAILRRLYRLLRGKSIQNILSGEYTSRKAALLDDLRICRSPNCTSPRAFSAARAYIIRLFTKMISVGDSSLVL